MKMSTKMPLKGKMDEKGDRRSTDDGYMKAPKIKKS